MTSNGKPVILIVDDAPVNVCILYGLLSGDHCIKVADSGASALELAAEAEGEGDHSRHSRYFHHHNG